MYFYYIFLNGMPAFCSAQAVLFILTELNVLCPLLSHLALA